MYCTNPDLITGPMEKDYCFSFEQLNIISLFQRLFTQLAVFMRSYINTSIFNAPSKASNAERLMQVSSDFRNAFLLFYGPEIADEFNNLFTNFIASSTNVIEGYGANNQELINQGVQEWYENADLLAEFLASINMFWDENHWKNLLYQYINLKIQMILAVFSGDYEREIKAYDKVFDLTTTMGSYMARGIIVSELQKIEKTLIEKTRDDKKFTE